MRPVGADLVDGEWVLFRGESQERRECEDVLARQGLALPLQHTCAWLADHPGEESWVLALRGGQGAFVGAAALAWIRTRALPFHGILRAEQLGTSVRTADDLERLLAGLHALARATPRALRLKLELYSRNATFRERAGLIAARLGGHPAKHRRLYARTLIVPLTLAEDQLLESFHRMVRKNLKKTAKLGHVVRCITDSRLAGQIDALLRETMARTGGPYSSLAWPAHIAFSRKHPDVSRISGLFLDGRNDPEALIAVRWCGIHGRHAQDLVAASTRVPEVPVMHAVMWDQLRWARSAGAEWFDFGGIPDVEMGTDAPLTTIADFKRLFTHQEETVGAEWSLPLRPAQTFVAAIGYASASAVRRIARWLRSSHQ